MAVTISRAEGYELLGVQIHPLSIPDLHAVIAEAVDTRDRRLIVSQNLHGVYVYHRDAKMRELHAKADFKRIDGMPLVMWARILGYPVRREHRVTWVDWLEPLMEAAAHHGWRVFYLGSAPGVAEKGADRLRSAFPALQIETAHGYFDARPGSEDCDRILQAITAFRADILIVGMGMPRQEHWILDHFERIEAPVILTSGAAMDYYAGVVSTPPRWMGRVGLEWLYRLMDDPRRLARRYLVEPWALIPHFSRDLLARIRGRNVPRDAGGNEPEREPLVAAESQSRIER